jgi:DNA-binding CsgD family transcriptional regulator/tetratricopeptide (TPR) repeat protein
MDVVPRRVSSATFVGRTAELAVLDAALDGSAAGVPAFAFVAGESGVGKSRLVGEFEARAVVRGARVLVGRCLELGGAVFPYAPLVDALRPVARDLAEGLARELPAGTRAALAELIPEFGVGATVLAGAGSPAPVAGGESSLLPDQARLFEAMLSLVERLGRRQPVVLILEDLHWADQSTRDFFVFLVRSARTQPLCLLVTYRADELHRGHLLRPVLAELERVPGVERIVLERFSREEVDQQLTGILDRPPDAPLADRLYSRAQGNPLYTEELLAASADGDGELPESLRDALLGRFERLPPGAQEVVRVAAAVERPLSHALLEATSTLAADDVIEGAREAVAQQILVTRADGTYAFRHALVGEAVYDDLLPGERTALHARLAEALARDAAPLGDPTGIAELAGHWYAARDLPKALAAAAAAGLAAQRVFAYTEALRQFERALELWDRVPDAAERAGMQRVDVLRRAAAAASVAFEGARPVALQREALADSSARADPVRLGLMHAELARYLRDANEQDESEEQLRVALELLPPEAERERAQLRVQTAKNLMHRGYLRDAAAEAAGAAEEARRLGEPAVEAGARYLEGFSRAALGDIDEGARLLRAARDLALAAGAPADHVRAVMNLSEILDLAGRTEEALSEVREALALVQKHAEPSAYGALLALQAAYELLRLGRTEEAARTLPDRIPGDSMGSTAMFLAMVRGMLATVRGDDDGAQTAIDPVRRQALRSRDPQWHEALESMTAELMLRAGRLEDARAAAARGLAAVEGTDEGRLQLRLLWVALMVEADGAERAAARRELFDDEPASRLRERLAAARDGLAQWAEGPRYAALADAELTRLEHAVGRSGPDPGAWLQAAAGFDELALPWPAAYARVRAAEAHVAAGDRTAAAVPLAAARAAAEAMQAAPLVEAADALARRARLRIEPPTPEAAVAEPAPLGLTPREHEVLLLVAEGRTNREIGETLFMSEKTASVHVSRILAKLRVGGRVEAAAVAHRLGLAD